MRVVILDDQLKSWRRQGVSADVICRTCGFSPDQYTLRLRAMYGLPGPDDPSTEEIEQRCLEIQATWSDNEQLRRTQRMGTVFKYPPDGRA